MGAAHSEAAEPASCVLRNQTGEGPLLVRTYEEEPLRSGNCEAAAEHSIPRHGQLRIQAPASRSGIGRRIHFAASLPPLEESTSTPSQPRKAARQQGQGSHASLPKRRLPRLTSVEPGAEVHVNVDKSGALAFRVFRRGELYAEGAGDSAGTWELLTATDATALFPAPEPAAASHSSVEQSPLTPSAPPAEVVADVEDESGLYPSQRDLEAYSSGATSNGVSADMELQTLWASGEAANAAAADEEAAAPAVPPECICPISHELFSDPVLAADGFTYERRCIEEWFRKPAAAGGAALKSPMTGKPLGSTALISNLAVRSLCQDYRERWGAGHGVGELLGSAVHAGGGAPSSAASGSDLRGGDVPGPFQASLPALEEMFTHLSPAQIRSVCEEVVAGGNTDLDVVVRRLLQLSEERQHEQQAMAAATTQAAAGSSSTGGSTRVTPMAGVSMTAVSFSTEVAEDVGATQERGAARAVQPPSAAPVQGFAEAPAGFEDLFAELVDGAGFDPVAARKAIVDGRAESLDEAVEWLEKHQGDKDLFTAEEDLAERERYRLYFAAMRIGTIDEPEDRLQCYQMLHKIMGRIVADAESARFRKIRSRNPLFRKRIARFPVAMGFLKFAGFKIGDYWTSHQDREPCVEFTLPVDSDNPASVRFVRLFSVLDEMLSNPEAWVGLFLRPSAKVAKAALRPPPPQTSLATRLAGPRERLAELHEWRARDPRGFQRAMEAEGRQSNRVVVDITEAREPAAPRLAEGQGDYQSLRERFGGRRHFNLHDIERMRVDDAIRGATIFAEEYQQRREAEAIADGRDTYSALRSRYYDPQYLGRVCVDRTNAFRAQNRLPPLKWSQEICDIAEEHARQMARGEMPFSHLDFDKRVARYPMPHLGAGENLAYNGGHVDVAAMAVQQWIDSPGHRRNLLGEWTLCGVGVAQTAGGMFYFTQLFARTPGALC
eukprot:TRINITY_DN12893_c0_g1_i1.p1 TRINITY_DN12893_c0_g1~~TRINITY_DN12893_c0_g1_i1.p1  ORF type:complete len:976 (+),score=207.52 TRINITY_DN12893_c0_g1_i1:84-2930(+)